MQTIVDFLTKIGTSLGAPISQILTSLGLDPATILPSLSQFGITGNQSGDSVLSLMGLSGTNSTDEFWASARTALPNTIIDPWAQQINQHLNIPPPPPPPGTPTGGPTEEAFFPQQPGIQLPPGMQPQPFQPPPAPNLPTGFTLPPELQALMDSFQGAFQSEQDRRTGLLDALQQAQRQQEANLQANQPMLDAALANIQSVLTGQAAGPGLRGLVESAYAPIMDEGQRRLRQTAEEAAAARGLHMTDTPIGQPYLDETRRFLEQMGGQQAQSLMGLRQQDASFSEQVRQFQEGLRQQAMTNRLGVIQSLGTPEQAGQVLGNLGLGTQQAALGQFQAQGQQALGASDLALRSALGASNTGLGLGGFGLASQAQGFQQNFTQQQAAIQNQLAAMQALGDPMAAFNMFSGMGTGLNQQSLQNQLLLAQALSGQPMLTFPTGSTTTGTQPSQLGGNLMGLGGSLLIASAMF